MKQFIIIIVIALSVVGFGALLFMSDAKNPDLKDENIITQSGIHWHPHMEIYVKGQKQEIPNNLGGHNVSMHTHDATGELHMEKTGRVTKDDIKVAVFFQIWGKSFNELGQAKMYVNDKENTELENYLMQDKDHIVIRYE